MGGALENVVIQAGRCSITLLPELGGKISSILVDSLELLQTPLKPLAGRTRRMAFSAGDASGWDECFPSVGECVVETEIGSVTVPDHGDLWRIAWDVLERTKDSATMRANGFSLPLELTRSLILSEYASGWRIHLMYTVANRGTVPLPWSWVAHPLFTTEPGDRIVLPASVKTLRLEGSGGNRLGGSGADIAWPLARLADLSFDDLSLAKGAKTGIGDKLFTGIMEDDWCSLERPGVGLRLTVRFDPALTPYLGLWICYGGWPDEAGPKQVCVALEPSTAPVDSLAETGPWSRSLAPGEAFSWPMEVQIDRMTNQTEAHPV